MTNEEKYQQFIDFIEDVIVFAGKRMNFGERGCPFCGHHYNHTADCLYLRARHLLATVTSGRLQHDTSDCSTAGENMFTSPPSTTNGGG